MQNEPPVLTVSDIGAAERFYRHALGCVSRRSRAGVREIAPAAARDLDLELHGHPFSLRPLASGPGRGDGVPPATLSVVLGVDDWCAASERLEAQGIAVAVEPARRPSAVPGEQCALRLQDPDGNEIELRGFATEAGQLAA